jgi:1-acyl-sn-glycerol-3-phosphate acyltransferase
MPLLAPLWKGLRIAEHLLTGAALAVVVATGQGLGCRISWLDALVRWWYRRLLRCLDVSVQADGAVAGTTLLVANHISWLDIPVIGSQGNMRFLSKAEVRRWPLIGWMSELAGTVFIARGANRVGDVIEGVCTRIQAGQPVVIFPEGTTSDGRHVRRFHPRLFAICQQTGLSVQPVALRYGSGREPDPVAPFVGDDTLAAHLWRLLRHPGLDVRVSFLTPIPVAALDRRRLADETRRAIAARLALHGSEPAGRPGIPRRGKAPSPDHVVQPGDAR